MGRLDFLLQQILQPNNLDPRAVMELACLQVTRELLMEIQRAVEANGNEFQELRNSIPIRQDASIN